MMRSDSIASCNGYALREDLAAAFRLFAAYDWHESVGNHLSAALSEDGRRFLLNPRWKHFAAINAFDLIEVDSDDTGTMQRPDAPDPSAWAIHGRIHAALPRARCILHLHPPYATALSTLRNPALLPIDGNTARFFGRVAIDTGYDGVASSEDEGQRVVRQLGSHDILMMGSHGVLVIGASICSAFEDMVFLEKACRTLMLAYASGQELSVMPDALALRTADEWKPFAGMADAHFAQLKEALVMAGSTFASQNVTGRYQAFKL